MAAVIGLCARGSATEPSAILSPRALPSVGTNTAAPIGSSRDMISLRSMNRQQSSQALPHRRSHALDLTHGKNNPDVPGVVTIPHWSDSFTYNGLVYKYTMVGTDPKTTSKTTVIPTVLIPLRFVFEDGNVFDASTDIVNGQTPIQGIINSPIFQNYNFNAIGLKVGNTQWGDAFQRANFWNSVSTRSPNYHVLLGQPLVAPVQTIFVPYGSFDYYNDPVLGPQPMFDETIFSNALSSILTAANVPGTTLPIIVWGRVEGFNFGGFHGVITLNGTPIQTYIATKYNAGFYFAPTNSIVSQDVDPLSHEIVEWMDDPFLNNFTPGWDVPFVQPSSVLCDSGLSGRLQARDLMEVGDVTELFIDADIAVPGPSYTYHLTDAVFIDYFTRATSSRSYNGRYSFFEFGLQFGLAMRASAPCTGHVEYTPTFVDFPGAVFTAVAGINNKGMATGIYYDLFSVEHGFVFDGLTYTTLDYPGASYTSPAKINDSGTIVGLYYSGPFPRGFSYSGGHWTPLDFPGAVDTEPQGINSSGAIVGYYNATQPVTRAFILQNGHYQDIPNPFGTQTVAFAINDLGSITGIGYTDPTFGAPNTAFILNRKGFAPFQFAGSLLTQLTSINNNNDLAGTFVDPFGSQWGMVTVNGSPYQVTDTVIGNNDLQQICGYVPDYNIGQFRGYIGTLPLQRNAR